MKKATPRSYGFSMIELLVAVAVLALMSALLLQTVGISSDVMSSSRKKLDGLAGARFALDRIGIDIAAMVNRPDVHQLFEKAAGNDNMNFFSEVDAYGSDRKIAAVGYRVHEGTGKGLQLERGINAQAWSDTLPRPAPVAADLEYDVLAEGVLRLEVGYVTKSGVFVPDANLSDLSNVSSIVVAVAVLDPASRVMLSTTEITQLTTLLSDPPAGSQDLISGWEAKLNASSLPRKAVQAVRFFQRYYNVR